MWSGLDRRQAPRHAERRARRVVAAVHDVPSRSQRLGKLQVLENGLLWATEKDALCQQPLPGAGTTGVKSCDWKRVETLAKDELFP